MTSLQCPLVGAHFRPAEAKAVLKSLSVGDRVELRADPTNQYDSTAVACWHSGQHLGFIPATDNSAVFAALMDGAEIEAEIIAFENTYRPVLEIDFQAHAVPFEPQPEEDMDRTWDHDEDDA